ncbi:MAG: hypothetical protein Q9183_005199 [Haloplaca sp. 2 TL-2023]
MADREQAGLLDVEKELTCSICTEILFQPLTLLDCLHTFCGSCLQEWFAWQATQASTSKPNPYTCPSCRASVRDTRPNATVTTLLEMYLQANAGRGRTQEEREQLRQKYKPGDQVLPRLPARNEDSDDERMLAEVREMSLREVGRMRIVGAIDMGQGLGMYDLNPLNGHEKVREDGQRDLHGTQPAHQKAQISHVKPLIHLFPDPVFYKLIQRLRVITAGLLVSREGNLPHPLNHRQEDVPSSRRTRHLDLQLI